MNAVSKSNTIAGSRRGEDCSRCRDLLIRTIAYRMQELGLSKASQRKLAAPYAACRSADGKRWVITAWEPNHRTWANPPCPCLHSDPKLPDCPPGATRRARGWLSFYEGTDLDGELRRLQGYTVAMAVEESRLLQVTIFSTLHKNATNLEFSLLLPDIVTIADEVDAQLKEQMLRFMAADAAKMAKGN